MQQDANHSKNSSFNRESQRSAFGAVSTGGSAKADRSAERRSACTCGYGLNEANSVLAGTRRGFVQSAVAGSLLFPGLISELLAADLKGSSSLATDPTNPVAPKNPHFPPKAKSVIFLFMSGGVSHIDSFDHKPQLFADHGKQVTFDHPETRNRPGYEKLFLKRPRLEVFAARQQRDGSQ